MAAQDDIRKTGIGELKETRLLAEVERDVAHVCLDVSERERELAG